MKNKYLTFLFLILSLIISCNYGYYTPINEVMSPVNEKGQLKISFTANQSFETKLQLSTTYSPINHLGLSYYYISAVNLKNQGFATGYFTINFSKNLRVKNIFLDSYIGYEIGENKHVDFNSKVEFNFQKYFSQVGFHYDTQQFSFDMHNRINLLDFKSFAVFGPGGVVNSVEFLARNDPFIFFELSPRICFGKPYFRIFSGANVKFGQNEFRFTHFEKYGIYTGIEINLNKLWKDYHKKI